MVNQELQLLPQFIEMEGRILLPLDNDLPVALLCQLAQLAVEEGTWPLLGYRKVIGLQGLLHDGQKIAVELVAPDGDSQKTALLRH